MLRLALFQPDAPQNTGTIIRLAACLGTPLDIIEPCGFKWEDNTLKRAAMDYLEQADCTRHKDWESFHDSCKQNNRRIALLTLDAKLAHTEAKYAQNDTLLLGPELKEIPQHVHDAAELQLQIKMLPSAVSINLALAAAIALSEAVRQIGNENLQ